MDNWNLKVKHNLEINVLKLKKINQEILILFI